MISRRRPSSRLAQTREAVERHREELALIYAVCEAANESTSLSAVLSEVTDMICEHMGWPIGHALTVLPGSPATMHSLGVWHLSESSLSSSKAGSGALERFRTTTEAMTNCGVVGRLLDELAPFSLPDIAEHPELLRRDAARELGLNHYYALPILSGTEVVAALEFFAPRSPEQPPEHLLMLLANIGTALGRVAEREQRERQRLLLIRTELAREEAVQRAAELQRLASELRRRNRELDQFAYVASHDLRAPLRGIANLAGWIAQDLEPHLTDDTRRYVGLLEGRVKRMEALISGLLEYSRVGRRATPNEQIDVAPMVREIVDLLEAGREIECVVGELPQVRGQRVLLHQVFHNLLSNAIKYTTCARPRIEVQAERKPDGVWRFLVRDNGPGIAPCYQDRIWEIFQTLQPRDDVESTGIGLSLVRKIVEQRGGDVGIDSVPGEGACFSFSWPESGPGSGPAPAAMPEPERN